MTPEDTPSDAPSGPELPDATERAVRRLLADARVTEPLPDEVAHRLDAALAALAGPSAATDAADPATDETREPAPVIDLATRRRRRLAGALTAAAAIVVVGVAVPPLLTQSGNDAATSAQDSATAEQDRATGSDSGLPAGDAPAPSSSPPAAKQLSSAPTGAESLLRAEAPRIRTDRARADIRADVRAALRTPATDLGACQLLADDTAGPGDEVRGVYAEDQPAFLVVPPAGPDGTAQVEVRSCLDGTLLTQVRVPLP